MDEHDANLCMADQAAARVDVEKFLFFLAGLDPRTPEDEVGGLLSTSTRPTLNLLLLLLLHASV